MSADPRIPGDKSFFRIGEVARIATVSCSKLRFWEKRFDRLAPARGGTGQRRYTREDVKMILFVKDRAEEGYGLSAIEQQITSGNLQPMEAPQLSLDRLEHVQERMDRVSGLLTRMNERLAR
ncbi:MAG: MerR family transcriptional regulator [Myxococcota bacterium]|nr:MerR family transcriptional regulator [Myxococcota bacterium]